MLLLLGSLVFTNVSPMFVVSTDIASRTYEVERELAYAVAWQESQFTRMAWSLRPDGTYDRGFYQISEHAAQDAARHLGWPEVELAIARDPKILYDPWLNAWLAVYHLSRMQKRYGDPWVGVQVYHLGQKAYGRGDRNAEYLAGVREAYGRFKGGKK